MNKRIPSDNIRDHISGIGLYWLSQIIRNSGDSFQEAKVGTNSELSFWYVGFCRADARWLARRGVKNLDRKTGRVPIPNEFNRWQYDGYGEESGWAY